MRIVTGFILREGYQEKHVFVGVMRTSRQLSPEKPEYINTDEMCLICFKPPHAGFFLIKHHIKYFPEVIAWVHFECHQKIHDKPLTQFIQYEAQDSKDYYRLKESRTTREGRTIAQVIKK